MAADDISKLKLDKTATDFRPKRRLLGVFLLAAIITAVAAIVLFLIRSTLDVETSVVARIYPSQSFTLLNASGYVVAQRKAAVASKATGRLVWLGVEEGSKVKAGSVIARLENKDVLAASDEAVANLGIAKAEFDDAKLNYWRIKELRDKAFVAQADLDAANTRLKRAQAGVEAAQAALRAAEVAIEYTLIRAPFNAVVLTKDADVGDIVTPLGAAANAKASVVTIADMSSLQVEVDVSESNLGKVRLGQPCEIQLDAIPDTRFRGVVHMIVPTADRTKASIMVKLRFVDRDARVLPEMSARAAFLERAVRPDEQSPRTAIFPAAVVDRNGKKTVFVMKDGRARERQVTLGAPLGDMVEVSAGLEPGERVILNPPPKLRDGSAVKRKEL